MTNQEQIFKRKKEKCPWRFKQDYYFQCQGAKTGAIIAHCSFDNCPIMFWTLQLKAEGGL